MDNIELKEIAKQFYEVSQQRKELEDEIGVLRNDLENIIKHASKLSNILQTSVGAKRKRQIFHMQNNEVVMVGWISEKQTDVFIAELI